MCICFQGFYVYLAIIQSVYLISLDIDLFYSIDLFAYLASVFSCSEV